MDTNMLWIVIGSIVSGIITLIVLLKLFGIGIIGPILEFIGDILGSLGD